MSTATAMVAIPATHDKRRGSLIATIATVAVANPWKAKRGPAKVGAAGGGSRLALFVIL